ncbi:MAG: 23S rRNA (guanosine(2251)-2'-O)-methyltransferase RlmB [Chloroflexota bacterium]
MLIIFGRNPVIEALKAGRPISRILLDKNIERRGNVTEIIRLAQDRDVPLEYVERQIIDRQGQGVHQGVIAHAEAKEYVNLDDLLAVARAKQEPPLYVILDGTEDPHNFGAILRTADATGVHGVIVRSVRAVGITPAVVKASAGAVEYVPVAQVTNIARTIETLKRNNVWVIGIDMAGKVNYTQVDFTLPTAIVIGGEGKGLSELVSKKCDTLASIPMKGKISSLNASVAAAVVMYETVKQRSK